MILTSDNLLLTVNYFMHKNEIPYSRILIIDDSEVDFFIVHSMLKRHKPSLSLYYAMDVDSALNMLKAFNPEQIPDLIILDMHFERQDKQGLDFLREFKTFQQARDHEIKIMALTAFAGFIDVKTFARDFAQTPMLKKPFSVENLIAAGE